MNIGRIFVSAVERRVAYVLVALVFVALGIGNARAMDEGQALQECIEEVDGKIANYHAALPPSWSPFGVTNEEQTKTITGPGTGYWYCVANPTAQGGAWMGPQQTASREFTGHCSDRPEGNNPPPIVPTGLWRNGAIQCHQGCMTAFFAGGPQWLSVPTGASCTGNGIPDGECPSVAGTQYENSVWGCIPPPPDECPAGQIKDPETGECGQGCPAGQSMNALGECQPDDDECPAGQIKSPDGSCIPGDGQCAAGEVKGPDGTCKPDRDGDGEPDEDGDGDGEDDKGQFSGGENCTTPPTCAGDNILCGQARIQWRIDCNTRSSVNISGGHCSAVPICTGEKCNALEYAQLLQQWKTACALEKMANGDPDDESPGGGGDGDADNNGVPDVLEGGITGVETDAPALGTVGEDAWDSVDTGGWLGGGSCPSLPAEISPRIGEIACQQGTLLRNFMDLLGLVFAAAIIGRAASGA